eukprot:1409442-Pyramimonas_sp.AAC.1
MAFRAGAKCALEGSCLPLVLSYLLFGMITSTCWDGPVYGWQDHIDFSGLVRHACWERLIDV